LGLKETGSRPLNGSLPNAETEREAEELVSTLSQNPLLNLDVMPLPYNAFGVGADGNEVMLQSTDANVQRAAAAAGIRLRAQHLASVDET
jgi:rRNA maturation endonuclease Nob1